MVNGSDIEEALRARAGGSCELCGGVEATGVHRLRGAPEEGLAGSVWVCGPCETRLGSDSLEEADWFGLRDAAWSEHLPVQVLSYRSLRRIDAGWARDLADQIYFDEDALAWVDSEISTEDEPVPTLDSNGTQLNDGDAVTLIKDLEVKGGGFTAKRGTMVKSIRLTGDPKNVEGRVNKMQLVLKTEFLKRA